MDSFSRLSLLLASRVEDTLRMEAVGVLGPSRDVVKTIVATKSCKLPWVGLTVSHLCSALALTTDNFNLNLLSFGVGVFRMEQVPIARWSCNPNKTVSRFGHLFGRWTQPTFHHEGDESHRPSGAQAWQYLSTMDACTSWSALGGHFNDLPGWA